MVVILPGKVSWQPSVGLQGIFILHCLGMPPNGACLNLLGYLYSN